MLRNELFHPWFVGEKDWGVEIIDGEFKGVSIQFENFNFVEGTSNLDCEYHVVHKPEHLSDNELKSELFSRTLELIVNDILKEAVENEQNRINNFQESNS